MRAWLIVLLLAFRPAALCGQDWLALTPNIVRVTAGNQGGSGTVVCSDGTHGWVLTCRHVFRNDRTGQEYDTGTATWPDGFQSSGPVVGRGHAFDTLLFKVPVRDSSYVPVSCEYPRAGETVQCFGYGGQSGSLVRALKLIRWESRLHGYKQYGQSEQLLKLDPYAQSGDSGGPVLWKGTVVGIVSGGELAYENGPPVDSHGPWASPILNLLREAIPADVFQAQYPQCGPRGCGPGAPIIQSPVQQGPRVIVQVPPRSPVQKTPIQKPDQPPDSTLPVPPTDLGNPPAEPPFAACPEKPTIQQLVEDTKKIQEEIRKLCERPLPEGLPGPPGPAGTSPPVSEIAQAVLEGIKSDPQLIALLKGPQGDPGPPGPQGPPGTSPEPPKPGPVPDWSHLVLVTPAKAEYAIRLADEIKRAQDHYNGLRVVEPPADRNIGPLPIIVAYQGGSPAKSFVGLRAVEDALTAIARGDYDRFLF